MDLNTPICRVLDLARWAPSGDNTQNARFEILSPNQAIVYGFDTRDHVVYDLDGKASQLALGALLETATIAASGEGATAETERDSACQETHPTFKVRLSFSTTVKPDPLIDFIKTRSVNRRALSTRPLTLAELKELESSVGDGYTVHWISSTSRRLRIAKLLFHSAKIRLTTREAYEVHHRIIEWRARYSEDKVPDQALGADPVTTRVMQFVLGSWDRVQFFNRFMAGTWLPRIQLDFVPALACASHFAIIAKRPPATIDDHIDAGRVMQRFWLTATKLGLQLQPEMTPLIFSKYAGEGRQFSTNHAALRMAQKVRDSFIKELGEDQTDRCVFFGRLGAGGPATARSLRKPFRAVLVGHQEPQ